MQVKIGLAPQLALILHFLHANLRLVHRDEPAVDIFDVQVRIWQKNQTAAAIVPHR